MFYTRDCQINVFRVTRIAYLFLLFYKNQNVYYGRCQTKIFVLADTWHCSRVESHFFSLFHLNGLDFASKDGYWQSQNLDIYVVFLYILVKLLKVKEIVRGRSLSYYRFIESRLQIISLQLLYKVELLLYLYNSKTCDWHCSCCQKWFSMTYCSQIKAGFPMEYW